MTEMKTKEKSTKQQRPKMETLEAVNKRGGYIPPEIEQIAIFAQLNLPPDMIIEIMIKFLMDIGEPYLWEKQHKRKDPTTHFTCACCGPRVEVSFPEKAPAIVLMENFDRDLHRNGDKGSKKRLSKKYKELHQKYGNIFVYSKINAIKITPNYQLIEPYENVDVYSEKMDLSHLFDSLHNDNLKLECGFDWFDEEKCMIGDIFILLPSLDRINELLPLIGIDCTFHRKYKRTDIVLTGKDQMKHNVPLAIGYISSENELDCTFILLEVRRYLDEKKIEWKQLKFITDKSNSLSNAITTAFPGTIRYYDTFHLTVNFTKFLVKHADMRITKTTENRINSFFSNIATCCSVFVLNYNVEKIAELIMDDDNFEANKIKILNARFEKSIDLKDIEIDVVVSVVYEFIFRKESKPKQWMTLMMEDDPCRFIWTTDQMSESTNHQNMETKDMKVIPSIYFTLDKFNKQCDYREMELIVEGEEVFYQQKEHE